VDTLSRLSLALQGAGNDVDLKKQIIENAPKEISRIVSDIDALGNIYRFATQGLSREEANTIIDAIDSKIKADNNIRLLIDYEISRGILLNQEVYNRYLSTMSPKKMAEQRGIHSDAYLSAHPELIDYLRGNDNQYKQNVLSELNNEGIRAWYNNGIV